MASIKQSEYEALASFRYALRQFLHFSEEAARAAWDYSKTASGLAGN